MRTLALMLLLFVAAPAASGQAPPSSRIAPDDAIRRILAERVDVAREAVGIVVGVIEPGGRRIVSYGAAARGDRRPLNGDTVFEIGSITKVFTSLLLADAVERKAVALSDPVNKFLPAGATVPDRAGRQVTLQDLAQHVSALPRLPGNMNPADRTNPYADYSVKQMYAFLPTVQFTRDIGAAYEYSNLAVGLLGHVLALQSGQDYETLVRTRITAPLGMTSTSITLSADQKARLAPGHGATLEPAPNWDLPTLAGAGALRSTANDMLTFLAAAMGQTRTPLAASFAAMLEPRRPAGSSVMDIALGWHILKTADSEIVWHNGGTGGYRTFAGYDAAARTGVVVLSNATTPPGPDDIGRHLLNPRLPLRPAKGSTPSVPARQQITIDPKVFDSYTGRYQLAPSVILTVSRDGAQLYAQLTGQPRFEVFPESETKFFLKVVDAQLSFTRGGDGVATAVTLHQNGVDQRAPRIP